MQRKILAAAIFALFAISAMPSHAQIAPVLLPGGCGTGNATGSLSYLTVDSTLKLCVNATVTVPSVTVGGFTPSLGYATLTASASSGSSALPSNSGVVAFQNTGSATVSCTLGVGSATALANEIQVPASSTVFVTVGSNTFGACIDQTGSASNLVVLAGGSGLGTGFGGGGGGGGSGGTVTQGPAGASAWLVTGAGGTFPVTGTVAVNNFPATQPISAASGADVSEGGLTDAPATVPTSSASASVVALLKALTNVANGPIPAGTATIGTTGWLPYPIGATPLTASATGTTAATTATLAGTTGKTTYICGYSIRANATANTNVTDTLTGVITGTMSSALWVPANTAGLGVDEQIFSPCIPASATNTAINAVSGAPGTGGVVTVKAWGFQL